MINKSKSSLIERVYRMKKFVMMLVCIVLIITTVAGNAEGYIEITGGWTMENATVLLNEQVGHVITSYYDNSGKRHKDVQRESWYRVDILQSGICTIRVKDYDCACWFDLMDRDGNKLERVCVGSNSNKAWNAFEIDAKQGEYYYLRFTPNNTPTRWGYMFSICANGKHEIGSTEMIIAEATCTETGMMGYRCELCQTDIASSYLPAKGHQSGAEIIIREATCLQTGEKGKLCKVCGETLSSTEIPLQNHTPGAYVDVKKATCTADGTRAQYCQVCNATMNTETVKAFGHSSMDWKLVQQATCAWEGRSEKRCSTCGFVMEVQETPMLEHQFSDWKVTIEATKQAEGEQCRMCLGCGYIEVEKIPKVQKFLGVF